MDGQNFTSNRSVAIHEQCNMDLWSSFNKSVKMKMWNLNVLLVFSSVLAGVIVGISVFGQRYRHHRFARFIFLGATTLFLPVVSTVVSMGTGSNDNLTDTIYAGLAAKCEPGLHSAIVAVWASLVQIIMINTSAVVAVEGREGTSISPPYELLAQGFWTIYLAVSYLSHKVNKFGTDDLIIIVSEATPFAFTLAKMVFRYYAFRKAQQSYSLRHNPRLVFAYMQQPSLQGTIIADDAPPPLLVMGEEKRHMLKQPHGYVFKYDYSGTPSCRGKNGLVTIDTVWKWDNSILFPVTKLQQQKDLCLSYALFKLLRCRFARYNVGSNENLTFFIQSSLLRDEVLHDRVFQVISDEICFVHDYYYSSIPVSYSKWWLPIVGISISLLSIAYCIVGLIVATIGACVDFSVVLAQMMCSIQCTKNGLPSEPFYTEYGRLYIALVPVFLLLVFVVVSGAREMASYICSNWTKVALICRLSNCIHKSWARFLLFLCKCKCMWMRHWDEKIGQCSVLVLRPRTAIAGFGGVLRHLFHLPDQKRMVKVPEAVKLCILQVLRNTRDGELRNGASCLRHRGQVITGESLLWACNNESTSYTILTWHIATCIIEVRYPQLHLHNKEEQEGSLPLTNTDYQIVATYLSRYCAYLVAWYPELLPDDGEWSRSLYEDVKKDAERALAGCAAGEDSSTPEAKCQQVIELLNANAKHGVLKDGAGNAVDGADGR